MLTTSAAAPAGVGGDAHGRWRSGSLAPAPLAADQAPTAAATLVLVPQSSSQTLGNAIVKTVISCAMYLYLNFRFSSMLAVEAENTGDGMASRGMPRGVVDTSQDL